MTILIRVEGVVKAEVGESVIPEGYNIYTRLAGNPMLVSESENPERINQFLRVNGLTNHHRIIFPAKTDFRSMPERRVAQVEQIRAGGTAIDLIVESDPEVAAATIAAGIPTLLFSHPTYTRPQFRPDYNGAIKPWGILAEEVTRQVLLRQADSRKVTE